MPPSNVAHVAGFLWLAGLWLGFGPDPEVVSASGVVSAGGVESAGGVSSRDGRVDFNRDIQPILAANCFPCHGFDQETRAADLRLDTAGGAHQGAIVPGRPADSPLMDRITSDEDSGLRMPPPESNLSLTADQVDLLRRWIQQGATYQTHWAFVRPTRPPVPELPPGGPWTADHPLDRWVQQRLQELGWTPAPPADRHTLIRRVSLDLLGLPPTAEDVVAFVNDPDPLAYENLVQRLLTSPHLGERLALDWLDAARYADTNGYSIDGGRHQWLWRDWVIQAFNDNLPYDQFLQEQLAGDLLPNRTTAQWIATGFQRNNMVTHEGGTIPAENLANYNADRVKTLGEAILGLTLGCAQCHNHKYDPLSQREYYQLIAFFNSLPDRGLDGDQGLNAEPSIMATTVIRTDERPLLETRIQHLEKTLATLDRPALAQWEASEQAVRAQRGRDFALHPARVLNVTTPNMGDGYAPLGHNGVRIRGAGGLAAFDVSLALPPTDGPWNGLRVVFHPLPEFPNQGWGAGKRNWQTADGDQEKGTFVLTAISATADRVPGDQINLHQLLPLQKLTASSWLPDFPPRGVRDPRNLTGWSPALEETGPVHFTATFAQPLQSQQTPYLTVQLNFGFGQSMIPGHFEWFVFTGQDDGSELPADVAELLLVPETQRTDEQWRRLWDHYAAESPALAPQRIELANLRERRQVLTGEFPVMVMSVAQSPRPTYVLHRGDYLQPGETVTAGTPAVLPPIPATESPDRLALARWLTSPEHPLTARVAVNRFWQMLFGRGLVATPADFGAQGQWPTHPELLDYLAVDFQEHGWDVKRLLFQIVTSQTYRQSSWATAEDLARDPANEWLARGPRFRLPAELIRDAALKTSGLWVNRLGGPSVNPYTPGDPWREVSHYGSTPATAQTFVQDQGEKLYRRSLYTYWKRTSPPTNLTAFDAPNREVCVVNRPVTTTPLQALVLLNDVQFLEASRALAQRLLRQPGADRDKLQWAVLETLGRPITPAELTVLLAALERERERYQADPALAVAYLGNGESPRDPDLPVAEHAAWSIVASLLLNLSEFITRN